ncbi:uncharacterized protein LOC103389179 isoform X2 [Cynoglossus semilaevis]|uniref:uncharacterized protein LOC103389179 isoform X2 n=1 Tax=Cynoglossus semilaevis TaxID=244447 RepID=UPI000496CF64|nr:uncharacterized protein LOC103389179 isoform X2 [Cynoglossus semilaevis]
MTLRWSHVFLVLAIPWVCEGQDQSPSTQNNRTDDAPVEWTLLSSFTPPLQETDKNASNELPLPAPTFPESVNGTDLSMMLNNTTVDAAEEDDNGTSTLTSDAREHGGRVATTVSMVTTERPPSTPVNIEDQGDSVWAYILLVFIIFVICVLCFILFHLRRVSRTYSFDCRFDAPVNNQFIQHTGSFEPVYLDDMDRPSLKGEVSTSDQPPGPTANGTSSQAHEKDLMGENTTKSNQEEHPDENRRDTSSDTGPVPDKGKLSRESSGSEKSEKQFLDGTEQQNENNNNPTGCCHDLFVEINLDEPAWCDQLLVSPEPSSNSVLPLSPFSFHSSSSSSSS